MDKTYFTEFYTMENNLVLNKIKPLIPTLMLKSPLPEVFVAQWLLSWNTNVLPLLRRTFGMLKKIRL